MVTGIAGFDHAKTGVAWTIVSIACVANFIDLYQSSMTLFALNAIRNDFGLTLLTINWVVLAYTLTFAIFLLPAGQMADRLGARVTFLAGTLTLSWTNALSAWTPTSSGLIAGRALAGVGAAAVSATGISIISRIFEAGTNRNRALTVYVSCAPLGTILGVIIGALLTESSQGWRSNFWLVFILVTLVFFAGIVMIPGFEPDAERKGVPIDFLGISTFVAGTALFIYGLNDAERRGWSDPAILVTIVIGALLLVSFPVIETRVANPVLPPSILFHHRVLTPLTTFAITGGCWVTWFYVATQTCLNSLEYRPVPAASYFLPATFAAVIGGGIGNVFVEKGKPEIAIIGGYTISIGALVPWGLVGPQNGIWYVIVFAMMYLFASPPITVGAQNIILNKIPVASHGTASALLYVAYQFGSSLSLAIANVVLASSDESTPGGLLQGYRNAMWTLLGITAAGFVCFVVMYVFSSSLRVFEAPPQDRLEANTRIIPTHDTDKEVVTQ